MALLLGPAAVSLSDVVQGAAIAAPAERRAATWNATESVQRAYDSYADSYDELDGGSAAEAFGLPEMRQQLLSTARGDVMEAGVGTGINLQYYDFREVRSYTGVDLSQGMLQQAERKATSRDKLPSGRMAFERADIQALPFPDASFDTVVDTFSLCVYPDPAQALSEMRRVLRPDGRLLLLAHSKSDIGPLALYQDVTAASVTAMGKGCVWNQDLDALLASAGLRIVSRERRLAGLLSVIVAQQESGI